MQYGEIGAVLYSFIWDLKVWRSDPSLATHCYLWYPNSTKSLSLCNSLPLIPHHWNTESLAEDVLVLWGAVKSKYATRKTLVTKRPDSEMPSFCLLFIINAENTLNSNDMNDFVSTNAISQVEESFFTNGLSVMIDYKNPIWGMLDTSSLSRTIIVVWTLHTSKCSVENHYRGISNANDFSL